MTYLRNAWYAAAFDHEVGDQLLARTLLDQFLVFYRDLDGKPVALADRCPHRFAPLSMGKLVDGVVQCSYHGMRFGSNGACVHNPHGAVPKAAQVPVFPLLERHGLVWIWMGEADKADPALLPDFSAIDDHVKRAPVRGYLRVGCNYQLVTDNLLDLSHVAYLHTLIGNADSSARNSFEMKVEGNTVYAYNRMPAEPLTPLWRMMWNKPSNVGDRRAHMRWDPPSLLSLDIGITECGRPESEGPGAAVAHILTPETKGSTHYFWVFARDTLIDDESLSEKIRVGIDSVFRLEDDPMVTACESRMGGAELMDLKPVMLTTDASAVRARRVLAALIEKEKVTL
ncbi:aromatic ring-hydroxylating dioxygenase subunit alpha [Herbaspirillum autotrophicum]|uniref:aromatic ring-hydroxylating dioxygenase subunit alpha n=1 Tax=Herbaspirillum autotrophicum TaxID=180195 RepID=UPI00067AD066|nr:aromatic ring-hydroxylating dioxygenase subunit alpha [Herbaspirillum autotrophicum]